jgi:Secretion system C-terminal sorting domain
LFDHTIELTVEDSNGIITFDGGIIFQGAGSDNTTLEFVSFNSPCFKFSGKKEESFLNVTEDIHKGSKTIDAPGLLTFTDPDGWIHLSQFESDSTTDTHHIIGQITQVVNPSTGEIRHMASKKYSKDDDLRVYNIKPLMNIGIENLKITRYGTLRLGDASNVDYNLAVNCWMKGVESFFTLENHVMVRYSSHIEISGCYFHDAVNVGEGGFGYGVDIQKSSTNCLVENNIFRKLRHAMLVQDGANANVFGYNYSRDQEWYCDRYGIDICADGDGADLCVHGDYAYSNLFESNWVTNIWLDAIHGWNGPFNTFLRNITEQRQYIMNFNAHYTNFVGNEFSKGVKASYDGIPDWIEDLFGLASIYNSLYISDTYFHIYDDPPNWSTSTYGSPSTEWWYSIFVAGGIPAQSQYLDHSFLNDLSYYKSDIPSFFIPGSDPWPGSGPFTNLDYDEYVDPHTFSIPAKWRWDYETLKTFNQEKTIPPVDIMVDQKNSSNTTFGNFNLWEETVWTSYSAPHSFSWKVSNNEVLRADQNINSNEKFKDWNDTDFLNHNSFLIDKDMSSIVANHEQLASVTIDANLHYGSGNVDVDLKDPWLKDLNETPYGIRNRGTVSVFVSHQAPYIVNNVSANEGVFLGLDFGILGKPYYSVNASQQTINGTRWDCYGWSKNGSSATFQDASNSTTAVKFNQNNAFVTAHYKGHLRSNLTNAFSSNSQRKHVRTDDSKYHSVYISDYYDISTGQTLPALYYTHSPSTSFEADWVADKLLGADIDIVNPSLDFMGNNLYIVFEDKWDPSIAAIYLMIYNSSNGTWTVEEVAEYDPSYFGNAKPVIAVTEDEIFVGWRESSSPLKYRVWSFSQGDWRGAEANIPNTTSSSANITIAGSKKTNTTWSRFVLAWQQSNSAIKYMFYERKLNNPIDWYDYSTPSKGGGFIYNEYPTISLPKYSTDEIKPILSWKGRKQVSGGSSIVKTTAGGGTLIWVSQCVVRPRGSSWGSFYSTGSDISNTTINSANSGESIALLNQSTGQTTKWVRRDNNGQYYTTLLSDNGTYSQPSNAGTINGMKAIVFKPDALPYKLLKSSTDFSSGMAKVGSPGPTLLEARQGTIVMDSLEFVFNISDVMLNSENIRFISHPDTLPVNTLEELNSIVRTEDFYLEATSEFYFTDLYYCVIDSTNRTPLQSNHGVHFKLELVNSDNNFVAAIVDEKTYDKHNIDDYANVDYQVNCGGITPGNYYLRLTSEVIGNAQYYLGNGHNSGEELAKKSYQNLSFSDINVPLSFKLFQNHPNPFNPTTKIWYEIPNDGNVKIVVYDVLGREVSKLVNDYKKAGRYSVNFDAKDLAAGLYLYRIISGEHSSQKKMLLIK